MVSPFIMILAALLLAFTISEVLKKLFGIPRVVGQVGAGLILSITVFKSLLFNQENLDILSFLANFGIILMFYYVGLEINFKVFTGNIKRSILISLVNTTLPLIVGFAVMKYVFDFIEYCIEKFDVGFFTFGDECFAPNRKRNWDFIEEYKKRKLDIIFRILGMRVDTVDEDILNAYSEIGCWMIEYGFEAGNKKMLNIIDKRVTVEQNRQVAMWTKAAGIYTSPTLVLGMPGETNETIRESIEFLKSLNFDFKQYQMTYALPIPGSPLYEFSKITGAVKEEDEYLSSLDGEDRGVAGNFLVNLTDESDEVVARWSKTIKDEMDKHYLLRKYKIKLLVKMILPLQKVYLNYKKNMLWVVLKSKAKKLLGSGRKHIRKDNTGSVYVRFKKPSDINIEKLIKDFDYSRLSRDMSLKKINEKLLLLKSNS